MTSYYPFDCVIWSLLALYGLISIISIVQYFRVITRDEDIITIRYIWPLTVQQQVHLVIFLLSILRIAFFSVSLYAWDPYEGEVISDKVAFYTLDEYATVLFFTLTSILALFWAELYYISKDSAYEFNNVIKPLTYVLNVLAFIGVAIVAYFVSTDYDDDIDYIFLQFTIIIATIYFLAAIIFAYYAHVASIELKTVPIQLSARRNRLGLLRILGLVMILALVIKAAIIITVTGKELITTSDEALSLVFLYYFFLEIFPLSVVLLFYKVDMDQHGKVTETIDEGDQMESIPLDPANNKNKNVKDQKTKNVRSPISNVNVNTTASGSMVDAIIARLSTGETISTGETTSNDGTESMISIGSGVEYRKGLRSNILASQNRYSKGKDVFERNRLNNSRDSRDGVGQQNNFQASSSMAIQSSSSSFSSVDEEYNKFLKEKANKLPEI